MSIERRRFLRPKENGEAEPKVGLVNPERGRHELYIREFRLPEDVENSLSKRERDVLRFAQRIVRRTASIYALQEGDDDRANFYPPKVTKNQISSASEENPELLSPFTNVRQNEDGTLVAQQMHQEYSEVIKKNGIINLLKKAAKKTRDLLSRRYFSAKARSFETGDWEASERIWLERKDEPKIDLVTGFYDTYTDKFLGIKYAGQAWAGVLNEEATRTTTTFKDAFLENWSTTTEKPSPIVKVRVDHTVIMSGQAAKHEQTGNSLPCQPYLRQELGSKFTIFEPALKDQFAQRMEVYKGDNCVIHPSRRSGIPEPVLWTANLRRLTAHEIGHSLTAPDLQQRFGVEANWMKEFYCDLLAFEGYFDIPQTYTHNREHEAAFAIYFAKGIIEESSRKTREEYFRANAIILKHCLERGSVKIEDGCLTWESPSKVVNDISTLFREVDDLQRTGTSKDAKKFREERFDENTYKYLQNPPDQYVFQEKSLSNGNSGNSHHVVAS